MADVVKGKFGGSPFRQLADLHAEMRALISQREDTVSIAEVLGLLRIVEHELISEASDA